MFIRFNGGPVTALSARMWPYLHPTRHPYDVHHLLRSPHTGYYLRKHRSGVAYRYAPEISVYHNVLLGDWVTERYARSFDKAWELAIEHWDADKSRTLYEDKR